MIDIRGPAKALAAVALLTLGACETAAWRNPNVPQERWSEDRRACITEAYVETRGDRAWAEKLERDSQRERDVVTALREQARRARALADRREQVLFETCMTEKGYVLTPAE